PATIRMTISNIIRREVIGRNVLTSLNIIFDTKTTTTTIIIIIINRKFMNGTTDRVKLNL
ncbi:hypothetical protein, partial [Streptococcus suis]|uniref:hypothetical protein n=1 Tax=Streptococcus suis TaxID=1307 RepID=UPI001EE0AF2E